jgi:hypothetical protein
MWGFVLIFLSSGRAHKDGGEDESTSAVTSTRTSQPVFNPADFVPGQEVNNAFRPWEPGAGRDRPAAT